MSVCGDINAEFKGETLFFKLLGESPSVTDAFPCLASVSISSVTLTQQGIRGDPQSARVAPYCKLVLALSL